MSSLSLLFNYALLLPLFVFATVFFLQTIAPQTEALYWKLFYLFYFALAFTLLFLPLSFHPGALPWSRLLPDALQNPWLELLHQREALLPSMRQGDPLPLMFFLLRHLGLFLSLMPLADFLYTLLPRLNYRACFALLFFIGLGLFALSFGLSYLTGTLLPFARLLSLFEALLGVALFTILAALNDFFDLRRRSLL